MMTNSSHQPAFYDTLIDWPAVEQAVMTVQKDDEKDQALSTIIHALDVVVRIALFHYLPAEMHGEVAAQLARRHNDPTLLNWLEEQHPGIRRILQDQLSLTVQDVRRHLTQA